MINGKRWVKLAWYHSLGGFVRGLEKNGFSALRFSLLRVFAFLLVTLSMYVLPYVLVFASSGPARMALASIVLFTHVCYAVAAHMLAMSPVLTLLVPFASLVVVYTFLRSTFLTLWRGGITWRETTHPLDELKRNMI